MDKKTYNLNKVEGFNPYDYIETATDNNGETIISVRTGNPLQYISTDAKTLWLKKVYPNSSIIPTKVTIDKVDEIYIIRAAVEIRREIGEDPVSAFEHAITVYDTDDIGTAVSKCQTIATGKALSKAGFGCEIELALGMIVEGEDPKEEAPKPKKEKPAKKAKEAKAEIAEEDEGIDDILDLLSEDAGEEESEEEEKEDLLEKVLKISKDASANLEPFDGLTFKEALEKNAKIVEMIVKNKRVRIGFSEETIADAEEILKG